MAYDLKLNLSTGDLDLSGDMSVSGLDAIKQRVWLRLSTHKGEWFADRSMGVDYIGTIFRKGTDEDLVKAEITREILRVREVTRVVDINVVVNADRTATIQFTAETTAGTITGEV